MPEVTGSFDVKMTPETASDPSLGRFVLDKTYHGPLDAVSKGEMLSILDREKGSGGYVALERVTGTLAGLTGSFALQHSGTMNRGVPSLSVTVVPDSGTGDLVGITGSLTIENVSGDHSYVLTYEL